MNKQRRLSPLDLLFNLGSVFKALIPTFIIFYSRIAEFFRNYPLLASLAIGGILLLLLVLNFLTWKNFVYWLEKDRLVIRWGIFQKEEKTIYYQRIHSVNIQQPLFKRIFNVAKLQIETPGGKKGKADGELRVLPLKEALQLQQQLQHFSALSKEKSIDSEDVSAEVDLETIEAISERDNAAVYHTAADATTKLTGGQLLKASLTSLNFGIAIAFIVGIISFADDVINMFIPSVDFDQMINETAVVASAWVISIVITLFIILFMWLLSIALYVIKFFNYQIVRSKEQIMISYGLLDKKSYIFDQKKVQAVIVEENILRQWLGFAELRVQVVTTELNQEQLVIHPFIRKNKISSFIEQYLPQRTVDQEATLIPAPMRSYRFYLLIPLIVVLIICAAAYIIWDFSGLWATLLIPFVSLWALYRLKAAGIWLGDRDLILRNRLVSRKTYYVKRTQIVTMQTSRSPGQRRKKVRSLGVRVLGSTFSYAVKALDEEIVLKVWKWYSKDSRANDAAG